MQSKSSRYKWCFVPYCKNTTITTPNKTFVFVPANKQARKSWFRVARREQNEIPTDELYCCQDHFDMQEDMENYMYHKMMGVKLKVRTNVLPHIFQCQPNRKRAAAEPMLCDKRINRKLVVEDSLAENSTSAILKQTAKETKFVDIKYETESILTIDVATQTENAKLVSIPIIDKECSVRPRYRSKAIYCNIAAKTANIATSPIKLKKLGHSKPAPIKKDLVYSSSDSEELYDVFKKAPNESDSQISFISDQTITEDTSSGAEDADVLHNKQILSFIARNPKLYIGIPKPWYWLVEFIQSKCQNTCTVENIQLTLMKIKLNDSFDRLGDQFCISAANCSKIFNKTVPVIAHLLKTLIYWPSQNSIKKSLPISFRPQYSHVQSIVDCLEIEIQKPTDPVMQALTWSEYKKGNTLKYLVSATPDGFINFVSTGYGGRTSDILIFEKCGFLDIVPEYSGVMADRGFKHVQNLLKIKKCDLVKPPSVLKAMKPTKEEVLESKRVASVRIHIERIVRRLREFQFLKPHSVIHHNLLDYTDDIIVIACALNNIQSSIIKM